MRMGCTNSSVTLPLKSTVTISIDTIVSGVGNAPAGIDFCILFPKFCHETLGRVYGPCERQVHEGGFEGPVHDGIVIGPRAYR